MDVSYVAHLNGLVILTSALFAFAKYLDSNHVETVRSFQENIRNDEELQPDDDASAHTMQEAKNLWDNICNEQPVSLKKHINALIALFIYLACLHAFLLSLDLLVDLENQAYWVSVVIITGKVLLLFAVICFVLNAWKLFYSRQREMRDKMTRLMNMEQELRLMMNAYRAGYKDANTSKDDDIPF